MKRDLVFFEDLREAGVLGQETVAGMHGIGACDLARRDESRDIEIAIARGRRSDADAFVRKPHVHGVGIGGRVYGDRRDAELAAGALNAQRNLSSVGNQNFVEHGSSPGVCSRDRSPVALYSMMISGSPYSTG